MYLYNVQLLFGFLLSTSLVLSAFYYLLVNNTFQAFSFDKLNQPFPNNSPSSKKFLDPSRSELGVRRDKAGGLRSRSIVCGLAARTRSIQETVLRSLSRERSSLTTMGPKCSGRWIWRPLSFNFIFLEVKIFENFSSPRELEKKFQSPGSKWTDEINFTLGEGSICKGEREREYEE